MILSLMMTKRISKILVVLVDMDGDEACRLVSTRRKDKNEVSFTIVVALFLFHHLNLRFKKFEMTSNLLSYLNLRTICIKGFEQSRY
jgi:hypothetical protein